MLANHCGEITHSLEGKLILSIRAFGLGEAISASLQAFINAVPAMNHVHNNPRRIFIFLFGWSYFY